MNSISQVEKHSNKYFKGNPDNEIMIERLKQIRKGKLKATEVTINFVKQEVRASSTNEKRYELSGSA